MTIESIGSNIYQNTRFAEVIETDLLLPYQKIYKNNYAKPTGGGVSMQKIHFGLSDLYPIWFNQTAYHGHIS